MDNDKEKPPVTPGASEDEEVTELATPEEMPAEEGGGDVAKERDEFKDKFLRTYAEFENFRKRVVREKEDLMKFGNEKLLKEVLHIKDDLERALEHKETADQETLLDGLSLIGRDLDKLMQTYNVKPIEALGQPFDPKIHEALAQEESTEHAPGMVISVFQPGYVYHDRLLRPARVVVAKAPAGKKSNSEPSSEG